MHNASRLTAWRMLSCTKRITPMPTLKSIAGLIGKIGSIRVFGKRKGVVEDDMEEGIRTLRRLTGGGVWSTEALLEQYRSSLYVFACISKIAEKVATIDLELFRVLNSRGDMKEVEVSPAIDLLYRCNKFQTRSEFWETTIINLMTTGDAFWVKVRNSSGKVVELWNLRPDLVTVVSDPTLFVKEYRLRKSDGSEVAFATDDVVHFRNPDPISAYTGMSPLKAAQRRVQTEDFATSYQRDFFLNSARPDAVIKNTQLSLTDGQKDDIREGWNRRFRGVGNNSKVAILEGGLEYQQISISQREMDYIESMRMTRDDILAAFKVPKPIIAITEDVNYANAKTAMAIFLGETIVPIVKRMVEKINEELIAPDFGEEYFLDFDDPTPSNREQELQVYQNGIANGWLLPNEVRELEGYAPITGGWTTYRPITDVAVGGLPQGKGMGGPTKGEAYENGVPRVAKRFSFKGRYWLYQKLVIREAFEKAMRGSQRKAVLDAMKARAPREEAKQAGTSLLASEEVRRTYAETINKLIDLRADNLKSGMLEFTAAQKDRVLLALGKSGKAVEVTVADIFDKAKESELAMAFILPYLEQFAKDAGAEALLTVAPADEYAVSAALMKIIKKRAKEFGVATSATTADKLAAQLEEGISAGEGVRELTTRVQGVFSEFSDYRAELIARTEATAANNAGMIDGFKTGGANGKEWINAGDDRVRTEHQDEPVGVGGQIVALEGKFSNGLPFPSEPNCRCVLGPAFIEK